MTSLVLIPTLIHSGIVNLTETLNLNPFYLTEFSNATYDKPVEPIEKIELFEDIKKYEPHTEEKEKRTCQTLNLL